MDSFDFQPTRPVKKGVTFRLAHASDGDALFRACYGGQSAPDFVGMFTRSLRRQDNGQGYHLLAVDLGRVVGTAQLIRRGRRGEIADVVVTADRRGEGIGSGLIELLERIAIKYGWRPVEIGVAVENVRARALYERLGYRFVKQISIYEDEEAVILQKW